MELFRRPNRDLDEIVALLEQYPSLTAEVIRRCSSSFFGNETLVTDINEAVFRLGFYEVYRLTVAWFGLQAMSVAKVAKSIQVEKLWRHSAVVVAIIGGAMARDLGESEGVIFIAGLLPDVGKIVLASAEESGYGELLKKHGVFGSALSEAERVLFRFNHSEVGARLLHRWTVPEQVFVLVLCRHEAVWSGPFGRPAAIVNLANLTAHCFDKTGPEKPCELPDAVHAMKLLKLTHKDMPRLELLARRDIKRLSSLFAMPSGL